MGFAASAPVAAAIVVGAGSRMKEAVEDVARRADDDTCVSMPDDQVAGFGLGDALKASHAVVEVVGIGIAIRKSCALVYDMNQV